MKILIYSPNKNVRESIKLLLARQYDLILTDSLDQCNECIKNTNINIIIIETPKSVSEQNSFEQFMKQTKNIPIILLIPRRHTKNQQTEKALQIVDTHLYINPIKEDELLNILKKLKT